MTTEDKPELVWHKMYSICSRHQMPDSDCHTCQATAGIEGYWGPPDPPVITCVCGFHYFDTCSACPLCNEPATKSL